MDDARDADVDVDAAIARCGSFDVSGAATGGGTRAVVDDDDDDDDGARSTTVDATSRARRR